MSSFYSLFLGALLFINLSTWVLLPEYKTFHVIFSGVVFGLIGIYIAVKWKQLRSFYQGNFFRKFSVQFFRVSLIAGILAFVNYLSYKQFQVWDLSGRNLHSIPQELKDVAQKFEGTVHATVFSQRSNFMAFKNYLSRLKKSLPSLKMDFFEPQLRPDLIKEYSITGPQALVLGYRKKREVLYQFTHLDFARAMGRLLEAKRLRIAYVSNHNEAKLGDSSQSGLSSLKSFFQSSDTVIEEVNLMREGALQDGYDALMIWGPKIDFTQQELSYVDQFLEDGARGLLLAIDPDLGEEKLENLRAWTKKYGFSVENAYVIDRYSFFRGSEGMVPIFQKQALPKEELLLKTPVFFPLAGHIQSHDVKGPKVELWPLLMTTPFPHSWAETGQQEIVQRKYLFNENADTPGPVSVASLVKLNGATRIFVFGNSTFVENKYQNFKNHFDLLYQAALTSTRKKGQFTPQLPMAREVPLFIGKTQTRLVFYMAVIVLPVVGLLIGAILYRRRGHL